MNYLNLYKQYRHNDKYLDCSLSINKDSLVNQIVNEIDHDTIHGLLNRYPYENYDDLKKLIGDMFHVDALILGCGSEDLICKVNYVYSDKLIGVVVPTFYRIYETAANKAYFPISFSADSSILNIDDLKDSIQRSSCDCIWIANPNSITGQAFASRPLADMIRSNSKKMFLIDETSLMPTAIMTQKYSMIPYCGNLANILVLRSFSKFYGFPGLRLGFAAGNSDFIRQLEKSQATYPINSLAISVIEGINNHLLDYEGVESAIAQHKRMLTKLLKDTPIKLYPSLTNTSILSIENESQDFLWKQLMNLGVVSMNIREEKGMKNLHGIRLTICSDENGFTRLYHKFERLTYDICKKKAIYL